jgi:hypothetical protein
MPTIRIKNFIFIDVSLNNQLFATGDYYYALSSSQF